MESDGECLNFRAQNKPLAPQNRGAHEPENRDLARLRARYNSDLSHSQKFKVELVWDVSPCIFPIKRMRQDDKFFCFRK